MALDLILGSIADQPWEPEPHLKTNGNNSFFSRQLLGVEIMDIKGFTHSRTTVNVIFSGNPMTCEASMPK